MKMHSIRIPLGGALATLAISTLAQGQISFAPARTYPCGNQPQDVVAVDLDRDGNLDLAATLLDPPSVAVLQGQDDGVFLPATQFVLPKAGNPIGLAALDYDGDGLLDLAVASFETNDVQLLHNDGAMKFAYALSIPVCDGPFDLAAGDIDADGDDDLAVSNQTSGDVCVLRNEGLGQFTVLAPVYVGVGLRTIVLGRFGHPNTPRQPLDVAVAAHGSHELHVLYNKGGGKLVPYAVLSIPGRSHPEGLVVGDFDKNGSDDLAACFSDFGWSKVGVFVQVQGGFAAPFCHDLGARHATHMVAADFDLDTRLDLACISPTRSDVIVLRRLENGQFEEQGAFAVTGPGSDHLFAGQLDRDPMLDIVATDDAGTTLSLLYNLRGNPSNYCRTTPNSVGAGARIGSMGLPRVTSTQFALTIVDAPPAMNGQFLYAATPTITPFHTGVLCLEAPIARVRPVDTVQDDGTLVHVLDFKTPPMNSGSTAITAGSVWNFQFWYRDITPKGYDTNLSDGLRVVFLP